MTPLVVEKLAEFLGKPEFCPHGTPMPGQSLPENSFTLDQAQAGSSIEVAMIGEDPVSYTHLTLPTMFEV